MFCLRAMREIQPKDIHASIEQSGKAVSRLAGRANSRQNFGGADMF
jgi:hypothetical protein